MKKALPIGYDNFERIISEGFYYVDKTMMIKEIIDNRGQVNLFTRPRRFGKTLTLSMLRCFFEIGHDNKRLFSGLKIMETGEKYTGEMGSYPVINLALKSAKQPTYELAYTMLCRRIAEEFRRHAEIMEMIKNEADKRRFELVMNEAADEGSYVDSIAFLSRVLSEVYGKSVIILIDEYDVPLENAYFCHFYDKMIAFIRSLFETALKTNDYLKFAVVTGCLRISKESIFTGLNNLNVISIMDEDFAEHFGFTQAEVEEMLRYYELEDKGQEIREWYDGYLFGKTEVYNPWSVINYVRTACTDETAFPKPYWANTSSNNIIRELVERADNVVKEQVENLIGGGTIEMAVHEDITYEDIYRTQDNLWNFLFFTGYLKKVAEKRELRNTYLTMAIPNQEVIYIYENTIMEWFEEKIGQTDLNDLYRSVQEGDSDTFERIVSEQLVETISFFDYAENYYHGFLVGLLKGSSDFITLSNRESGNGRPDILMRTPSVRGMAIIMEIKVVKEFDKMEEGCRAALRQIREQNYEAALYKEGYRRILKYGICFYRKECMIKRAE